MLCDPQGHVAIDSSGMLQGADGRAGRARSATRSSVHMDREALGDYDLGEYDVTVSIATYEPDREIAWTVLGRMRPQIGHVYGYRLEPTEAGTRVTSYYDWSDIHEHWREADIFPVISETRAQGDARASSTGPSDAATRAAERDGRPPVSSAGR